MTRARVEIDPNNGRRYRQHRFKSTRCGKLIYTSRKEAAAAAAAARRISGETIKAYKCRPCHGFHIGHPPGSRAT